MSYDYFGPACDSDLGEWPSVEEVTIEPDEELTCSYCGKPADEKDFWQDSNPIFCGSDQCVERRIALLEAYQRCDFSKSKASEG